MSGGGVAVGVEEAANNRVVISGLQILPARLWCMLVAVTPKNRAILSGAKESLPCISEAGRPASIFSALLCVLGMVMINHRIVP